MSEINIYTPQIDINEKLTQDWGKIREHLLILVEQKIMSYATPFDVVYKCKNCNMQQIQQGLRPLGVELLTDFIIEQMEQYLRELLRFKNTEQFRSLCYKHLMKDQPSSS